MRSISLILLLAAAVVLAGCESQSVSTGDQSVRYLYTVRSGDSLETIADRVYGDASATERLRAANPGVTNATLKPGQELTVPMAEGEAPPIGCDARKAY